MYRADDHVTVARPRTTRRIPCDKFNTKRRSLLVLWWKSELDRKLWQKTVAWGETTPEKQLRAVFSGGYQARGDRASLCKQMWRLPLDVERS